MKTRRWAKLTGASMCLAMGMLAGCQTWVPEAGLTLPSGSYLRHPPQYIPRSPAYPLTKELASLEEAAARQNVGPLQP